jgi:hypothetical protein
MSKYELTGKLYSMDVVRTSDSHACAFMCSNVWKDMGAYTYYEADDDEVKSGAKKEGDLKAEISAPKGWQQEDWNWDTELKRVFGEVDVELKTALESHFTSTMKANYLASRKSQGV